MLKWFAAHKQVHSKTASAASDTGKHILYIHNITQKTLRLCYAAHDQYILMQLDSFFLQSSMVDRTQQHAHLETHTGLVYT